MKIITIILLVGTNETYTEPFRSVQKIFHYYISNFPKKQENIKAASVVEKIIEFIILMVDHGSIHTKIRKSCGIFGVSFIKKIRKFKRP